MTALGSNTPADEHALAGRAALSALCWFADVTVAELKSPAALADVADDRASIRLALVAASLGVRAGWLAFDAPLMEANLALCDALARRAGDEEATLIAAVARAWWRMAQGDVAELAEQLRDIGRRASAAKLAVVVVEASVLQALALCERGELSDALDVARRAVRMAQTESLPQEQYLAGIVLARTRRLGDNPHLASRILARVTQLAPSPWRTWTSWELLLAAGASAGQPEGLSADGPPALLQRCLHAAMVGGRAQFEQASHAVASRVDGWSPLNADWLRIAAVLDVSAPCDEERLSAWRRGQEHEPPFGLSGLMGGSGALACVVTSPTARGVEAVRIASLAAPLAVERERLPGPAQSKQQRAYTLIVTVAMAPGADLDEERAFQLTYGFEFERALHRDIFNVLIHRARQLLGEGATLERDQRRLRLTLTERTVFPEPRCNRPLSDRVLHFVSHRDGARARDVAESLDVSLRSAQKALDQLIGDGACAREKQGRSVEYVVEDTSFRAPTNHDAKLG